MMGLLGWAIFGLIIGALAKLAMPGKDPGGIIVTMLIGIVGAVVAGYIGQAMGLYAEGQRLRGAGNGNVGARERIRGISRRL
jgi:uncharacterized membrane protein YeaQ/YmgE (transglycosylase-associated protein family)